MNFLAVTLDEIAANPWPWISALLAGANSVQYARAWQVERERRRERETAAAALQASQDRNREDMQKAIPVLTKAIDLFKS